MPLAFFSSVPCRHADTLYFGGLSSSDKGWLFHLYSEQFEVSAISYGLAGSSVALALPEEEIVVLAQHGVYSYSSQASECFRLAEAGKVVYMSGTAPVRCQGVWYFLGRNEEAQMMFAMEERSKEIRQLTVLEQGPDRLQRLLSGRSSLKTLLNSS
jgi:hypothetical protein